METTFDRVSFMRSSRALVIFSLFFLLHSFYFLFKCNGKKRWIEREKKNQKYLYQHGFLVQVFVCFPNERDCDCTNVLVCVWYHCYCSCRKEKEWKGNPMKCIWYWIYRFTSHKIHNCFSFHLNDCGFSHALAITFAASCSEISVFKESKYIKAKLKWRWKSHSTTVNILVLPKDAGI